MGYIDERREFERFDFKVTILDGDRVEIGDTKNISKGGIFLVTDRDWPVGAEIPMQIEYQGWSFKVVAEVRHHKEDGVGLKFVGVGQDFMDMIEKMIEDSK